MHVCGGFLQVTELWMSKDFAVTYSWIHNVLRSVVPLCIMCSLNCCIVFALRQSSHRLAVSRRPELDRRRTMMSPRNRRVTLMLVAVIGLFILFMRTLRCKHAASQLLVSVYRTLHRLCYSGRHHVHRVRTRLPGRGLPGAKHS